MEHVFIVRAGTVKEYSLLPEGQAYTYQLIKPAVGGLPVIVLGGLRRLAHMEALVQDGSADSVAMARPFVREPALVRQFREGKAETAACVSCNRCLAAISANKPLRCAQTAPV